jgi:NADH:ubiquinone oxidoreductase subunit 5 (subunit L)/multisubunit Na+/H+ antiporter MnhA subunit
LIVIGLIILALPFIFGISMIILWKSDNKLNSIVSPAIYGICFILSLILFFNYTQEENVTLISGLYNLDFAFAITRLSSILLLLFSFICFCNSLFYRNDTSGKKIFNEIFLAFSAFAIFGLALSGNMIMLFIFSVIIGLITYFKLAAENKKLTLIKSIVINTISDLAFLAGILLIFSVTKSFSIEEINKAIDTGMFQGLLLTASGVCLLIGVLAKSAVFPFHYSLTTKEKISPEAENTFLSLTLLPAGIILAMRISPLLFQQLHNILIIIGLCSLAYGVLLASFKDNLKDTIKHLSISQSGLMLLALGTNNIVAAVLLLVTFSLSRMAISHSHQLINGIPGEKQNILYYWIFFCSVIVFAGLPLTAQFLSIGNLIKGISGFNYDYAGLNIIITVIILVSYSFFAFNIFKFLFRIDIKEFDRFSIPGIKELSGLTGSILLLLSSLFFLYSFNPVNSSTAWLINYLNNELNPSAINETTGSYLESFSVLLAVALGVIGAFFYAKKPSHIYSSQTNIFYRLELFFDNQFARLLAGKSEDKTDNAPITLSGVLYKYFKIEELSSYIALSLLLIVIFYFIFRTM